MLDTVRRNHLQALQIDRDRDTGGRVQLRAQLIANLARQLHRQQTVLQAIIAEYVAETRRDDASNAKSQECVHGGFARRTAAKILIGDQHPGAAIRWRVEIAGG